jgi:hypothetical protein
MAASGRLSGYGGEWPAERFREHGIDYRPAEHAKSDLYREVLPLLNGGRIELLDHARLAAQLCGLERRTARGGRDSIDHAPGAHDDLANAVVGVAAMLAGGPGPARSRGIWQLYKTQAEARGFVPRPDSVVPLPLLQRGFVQ